MINFMKNVRRSSFSSILNSHNLINEGAEIGVLKGRNAANILAHWNGKKLHLIDSFKIRRGRCYRIVQERFKNDERVVVHNGFSIDIAKTFKDNQLDWVYIDACHEYTSVCADLISWYRVVKTGGIIAGHDYRDGDSLLSADTYGVKSAVDMFSNIIGIDINIMDEGPKSSWFFIKK